MINTAGYKICDIEKENDELALEIAAEGIVLLENSGALPLKSKNVALYGSGARNTCKGGTGAAAKSTTEETSMWKRGWSFAASV